VESVNSMNTEEVPSWRSVEDIAEIGDMIKEAGGKLKLTHVYREVVQEPHQTTNYARRKETTGHVVTKVVLMSKLGIMGQIGGLYFNRSQDEKLRN
jgi:hypothetical protein